jgi:hypothetical protein
MKTGSPPDFIRPENLLRKIAKETSMEHVAGLLNPGVLVCACLRLSAPHNSNQVLLDYLVVVSRKYHQHSVEFLFYSLELRAVRKFFLRWLVIDANWYLVSQLPSTEEVG